MNDQYVEIVSNNNIAQGTFLMGFRSPEIVREAKPGQFVMIRISEGIHPLLRRPFSICGIQGGDTFLVLYRIVGRGTEILSKTAVGEHLMVLGPLGNGFKKPEPMGEAILVAGGIGLAPLLFLAREMETSGVTLFIGYGTAGEIVDLGHIGLGDMALQISTEDGTKGHKGLVTDLLEFKLEKYGGEGFDLFVCGPHAMLRRVADLALHRAIPCQVCFETQMACGMGACQGCAVPAALGKERTYYHVCQDGPVFHVEALDWMNI